MVLTDRNDFPIKVTMKEKSCGNAMAQPSGGRIVNRRQSVFTNPYEEYISKMQGTYYNPRRTDIGMVNYDW